MVLGKDARHTLRMEELERLDYLSLLHLRLASYAFALYGVLALACGTMIIYIALVIFGFAGVDSGPSTPKEVTIWLGLVGTIAAFGFMGLVIGISAFFRTLLGRIMGMLANVFLLVGMLYSPFPSPTLLSFSPAFTLLCLPIPLIGLAFFWREGTLFGHNRYRHREIIQAVRKKKHRKH